MVAYVLSAYLGVGSLACRAVRSAPAIVRATCRVRRAADSSKAVMITASFYRMRKIEVRWADFIRLARGAIRPNMTL